ncbi:MAG: putative DNA-binding domain-containing protein [Verrucomicrobia bacterium]|nr:putative DNA-binding domain-containing protein [Verrucomicrobiota bacterium]
MQAPEQLSILQHWFGGVISRPLTEEGKSAPIDAAVKQWVLPSPTLAPDQRMEIYNQQYWYRLLTVMQENFPLVAQLIGYATFNELATAYLIEYPPHTWRLTELGHRFADWVEDPLLKIAGQVDWAWEQAFIAPAYPPLSGNPTLLLQRPWRLQPHLTLLELACDLLPIRDNKEGELVWEGPYPVAIFRTPYNDIAWARLHLEELKLLQAIASGQNLLEALEQFPPTHEEELPFWIQNWVIRQWLA